MNKYDYGYELVEGSTNKWAFDHIQNNVSVLELGSSNGNLVYHLTTQKSCIADIIEINEEAGQKAAQYARNACIGRDMGDLEKDLWYQKLSGNHYDYIVILDVLEHIRNPKEVLLLLSSFLKETGKILLSIPNIAHNSVIINLLQNKFEYTDVGLLDDTHVHFYTYSALLQMLESAGLKVESCEAKQVAVNNNEIDASYGQLPREVDAYLKTREQGTVYQFLLTASRQTVESSEGSTRLLYQKDVLYKVVSFNEAGSLIAEKSVNPCEKIILEIPVSTKAARIRIDPLDTNCIISDVQLAGRTVEGGNEILPIAETTGNQFGDKYAFYDDDPQIYAEVPDGLVSLTFSCTVNAFDSSALAELAPSRDMLRQTFMDYAQLQKQCEEIKGDNAKLQKQYEEVKDDNVQFQKQYEEIKGDNAKLQKQYEEIKDGNAQLQKQYEDTKKELEKVLDTIWGKIYYKLNK